MSNTGETKRDLEKELGTKIVIERERERERERENIKKIKEIGRKELEKLEIARIEIEKM